MPSTTLTIDQIEISRLNVRTYRPDAEDTAALEASIAEHGLRDALHVHPLKGTKGKWGAIDGQRRYRSIKALVARGALPADWPVPVVHHDTLTDAELVELSISENLLRKDLRVHELAAGIARASRLGHDVETIARQLGQHDRREVARWLALGKLPGPIFEHYLLSGDPNALDLAKAFASVSDETLQLAVFERLRGTSFLQPATVRNALGVGDRQRARDLTFVGEAVYRAAGGGYELDLFADSEFDRGRVTDPALLARLVEEKMATIRDQVRVTCQNRELRFVAEPPESQYGRDHQLQVTPKRLASGTLQLPAGDVVAHIEIDRNGEPVVTYWWASRTAKFGDGKAKEPRSADALAATRRPLRDGEATADDNRVSARVHADAAIKEEDGLGQDNIQIARSLRKQVLRALFVDDARQGGDVATDYLVWAQLRMLAGGTSSGNTTARIGMRSIYAANWVGLNGVLDLLNAALEEQPATATIAEALREITAQSFFTGEDLGEAFLDYRASPDSVKQLAAAIVAGLAIERSLNAPGYGCAPHDVVFDEIVRPTPFDDPAIRRHWTPTESFLAMLPKKAQLAIAEPLVDATTLAAWGKRNAADLTFQLHRLLTGASPSCLADKREAAERWVHPLLRFEPPGGPDEEDDAGVNDALELAEAAE